LLPLFLPEEELCYPVKFLCWLADTCCEIGSKRTAIPSEFYYDWAVEDQVVFDDLVRGGIGFGLEVLVKLNCTVRIWSDGLTRMVEGVIPLWLKPLGL
jgi:hypothetical protein